MDERLSLIIAFIGSREAVIGGDRRSITFLAKTPELEEELYLGKIRNDEELKARARELGASIQVSDGREKVWRQGDILVGEVTEISSSLERRRRIYLAPGAYVMADITGIEAKIISIDGVAVMVLGNKFTQKLAGEGVAKAKGIVNEQVIKTIFEDAGRRTASVSREYTILRTGARQPDPEAAVFAAFKEDCRKSGRRLCGQQ